MERPVMNPMDSGFEPDDLPSPAARRKSLCRWIWRLAKLFVRIMLSNISTLTSRRPLPRDQSSRISRILRGILYRLAVAPVLLGLIALALVWSGTHPRIARAESDPVSQGLYYDPVNFMSEDGLPVSGWLVPVIDAQRVLAEGDAALIQKRPAIVIVPGFASSLQRILPLIKPLHDQGWVVLAVSPRGSDLAAPRGQTFGLNESLDVTAAVRMLRRRAFVDPSRIAVLGVGCGANAAVLAAEREPAISVLVLDSPLDSGDSAIEEFIGPAWPALRWINPLCKWTFDIAYGVDADDLNLDRHGNLFATRPTLILRPDSTRDLTLEQERIDRMLAFLRRCLRDSQPAAARADP